MSLDNTLPSMIYSPYKKFINNRKEQIIMAKKRINITVSPELITKLQEEARTHYRSLSNEIEYRLMQSFTTPASTQITPAPFTPISTPENPTGGNIITADGTTHKKHPLIWLQENKIDPMDTSHDTYERFHAIFPDVNILEFDSYQQSRRK